MTLPKGCKLLFRKDDYKDDCISYSENEHKKKSYLNINLLCEKSLSKFYYF